MLKVLDVEGAVAQRQPLGRASRRAWDYDAERYAQVTALRRHEQEAMAAFGSDGRCLMRALEEELDDPAAARLRPLRRLHRAALRRTGRRRPRRAEAASTCASQPLEVDVKKMAPDAEGAMQADPRARSAGGRPRARALGDAGWDDLVEAGRRAGRSTTSWSARRGSCASGSGPGGSGSRRCRPIASRPLPAFAARLAGRSACHTLRSSTAHGDTSAPARDGQLRQQAAPTSAARSRSGRPARRTGLLVDDLRFSGWTLAMVGGQLRQRGCPAVYPLALSTAY